MVVGAHHFEILASVSLEKLEQQFCRVMGKRLECDMRIIPRLYDFLVESRYALGREIVRDVDCSNDRLDDV